MTRPTRRAEYEFPETPADAKPADRVPVWELRELWQIAAELCNGRDPHQMLWATLHERAVASDKRSRRRAPAH